MTSIRPPESRGFRNPGGHDVVMPLSFPATGAAVAPVAGDVVLYWWAFTETTGTGRAVFTVFDGADATGQELFTVTLAPGESVREDSGTRGLYCTRGLAIVPASGSVRGTLGVANV